MTREWENNMYSNRGLQDMITVNKKKIEAKEKEYKKVEERSNPAFTNWSKLEITRDINDLKQQIDIWEDMLSEDNYD